MNLIIFFNLFPSYHRYIFQFRISFGFSFTSFTFINTDSRILY